MADRAEIGQWLAGALAGMALVLTISGCTGTSPSAVSPQTPTVTYPVACGAATDIANEPNWRQYADYRTWTTADGCVVRIDVLADGPGPAHCGFESARVIVTGIPIGARYSDDSTDATYVRDPGNVFADPAISSAFDPDAKLADGAVDTGLRLDGTQLWVDPTDRSAIYLVAGTSVERWPLDQDPALCA